MELLRDTEPGPASGGALGPSGEEAPRPRMSPATIAAKVGASSPGTPARAPPSLPGQGRSPVSRLRTSSEHLVGAAWSPG